MREIKVQCPLCNEFHIYRVLSGPAILQGVQNSALRRRPSRGDSGFLRRQPLLAALLKPSELSSLQSRKYKIKTICPSTGRAFVVSLKESVKLEYIVPISQAEISDD